MACMRRPAPAGLRVCRGLLPPGWPCSAHSSSSSLTLVRGHVGEAPPSDVVCRLVDAGGTRVPARNSYWDQGRVMIADPDGYRLVQLLLAMSDRLPCLGAR